MSDKTVSTTYFLSAFQSCIDAGCSRQVLMSLLKIDEAALRNPIGRLPAQAFLDLLHVTEAQLGEPGIGVKVGQEFRPQTFRDIGYVAMSCANIDNALALNRKYQRLTQEIGVTRLVYDNDLAAIIWEPHNNDVEFMRPMVDAVFSGYFTVGLWMAWINNGTVMSKVQFRHGPTAYSKAFEDIFNCEVEFHAPRNAMVFDAEIAKRPFPQYNPEIIKLISQRLDVSLLQLNRSLLMHEKAYDVIEAILPRETPTISRVSQILGLSERSLRRHLKLEGTSYREQLQLVRRKSCEIHLRDPNVALADISQKLGFCEQSSFTHAFKSWYGVSPRQYANSLNN